MGKPEIDYSIVIPTLNEEHYIHATIEQFQKLDGHYNYEVLIGDGGSTDRTCEIAESLGATVVHDDHPLKTVASGRNAAGEKARGKILIFCDADTVLSDVRGLARGIEQRFADREIIAAIPKMEVFPESQIWKDKVFQVLFNNFLRASFAINMPFSRGQCQIIRADAFAQVGGYNPEQIHADDNTIFQKLGKIGKLIFINEVIVYESPRRYRKVGYLKLSAISAASIFGQAILKRNILTKWERVD